MALRDFYTGREDPYAASDAEAHGHTDSPGLLRILWRRRLIVLTSVLVCLGLGVAYILFTPPKYLATATILIDPRLGKVVGTDPVQPGYVTDTGAIESQIKLFTSQTVLSRVAKMAKLADDPEFNGSQRSLLDRILHPQPPLADSVDLKALEDAITVKRPDRTYVVTVGVLARDPDKSAQIANDVVQAYIDDQVSSRVEAAGDDTHYVREKLDKLSQQIRDADEKIEAYKASNKIVDANGLRSNEQQVADLMRALADARAKTSDAEARLTEIDKLSDNGHLDAASQALNSLTIERLRQQQAEAEQTAARLATTLGPLHPELKAAKGRAAKAARLIRDELQRLKIAAKSNVEARQADQKAIQGQVDALKGQSANLSQKLVPLEQLQRNAGVLRSSFQRFSQVNDNLAQQAADSPPGRLIGVARPPVSPAHPKKTLALTIALAAGIFLGVALAFASEDGRPQNRSSAEPYPPPPTPKRRGGGRRYWDDDDI